MLSELFAKNSKSVVHIWYKVTIFLELIVLYRCVIYQIVQNWQLYKIRVTYIYSIVKGYWVICKTKKIMDAILDLKGPNRIPDCQQDFSCSLSYP